MVSQELLRNDVIWITATDFRQDSITVERVRIRARARLQMMGYTSGSCKAAFTKRTCNVVAAMDVAFQVLWAISHDLIGIDHGAYVPGACCSRSRIPCHKACSDMSANDPVDAYGSWLLLVNGSSVCMLRICVLSPSDPRHPYARKRLPAYTMPRCMFHIHRSGPRRLHVDVRLASC